MLVVYYIYYIPLSRPPRGNSSDTRFFRKVVVVVVTPKVVQFDKACRELISSH